MKAIYLTLIGMMLSVSFNSTAQTATAGPASPVVAEEDLPAVGVRYYYYPNLDAYFDNRQNVYIYEKDGQWIKSKEISSGYRGYSVFNGIRFEISDYHGEAPYTKLDEHREKYPKKYSAKRKAPKPAKEEQKVAYN